MIKTVVREHHYSPAVVGDFYLDEQDFESLGFWYYDVLEVIKKLEEKTPKSK